MASLQVCTLEAAYYRFSRLVQALCQVCMCHRDDLRILPLIPELVRGILGPHCHCLIPQSFSPCRWTWGIAHRCHNVIVHKLRACLLVDMPPGHACFLQRPTPTITWSPLRSKPRSEVQHGQQMALWRHSVVCCGSAAAHATCWCPLSTLP